MIISNGKDRPLNTDAGTMPDVSGALMDWFQPMVFAIVTKTVSGFQAVETKTDINFQGVLQPMSGRQLMMKPEGQRKWNWFQLHAEPGLTLTPDDVVFYLGVQYRVMSQKDYRLNGYVEYTLVNDYTGAGPYNAP